MMSLIRSPAHRSGSIRYQRKLLISVRLKLPRGWEIGTRDKVTLIALIWH